MKSNSGMHGSGFFGSISASDKQKWSSKCTKQRPDAENEQPVDLNMQMDISSSLPLPKRKVSGKRNIIPKPASDKHKWRTKQRPDAENEPLVDPNMQIDISSPVIMQEEVAGLYTMKEEMLEAQSDPSVKVVVRIRPANTHERGDLTVRRVSDNAVAICNRKFSFDAVLDSNSNQEEMFNLVGVPLVKDSLAGYNTSVLAYGQTGSGKTYTMWGPPSAMMDTCSTNSHQGIVPRIFEKLFSEIQKDQDNSSGKQINYQLHCSFLELYNDQIGDLLDLTQQNLEIKDDTRHGFYVENLIEEYVTTYEDITQILIKGLSCRKVGATSLNSKSSLSHIVFTCVIESSCKGMSANCFGSSKSSRISFVDLAGIERNKLDDSQHSAKEERNVKKSLSQLGYLVNLLAEGAKSGKPEDDSYRSTSLTHLLKESLGGNVKLSVICTISKDAKSSGETLSTLRFGQRAKCILNDPVVNEISEIDANDLSDQIHQLKEEFIGANNPRKCVTFASSQLIAGVDAKQSDNATVDSNVLRQSLGQNGQLRSSLRSSKICPGPTELLAANLHRGLQIIDCRQQQHNSAPRSSLSSSSFEHLALKASPSIDKRGGGEEEKLPTFICTSCRRVLGPSGSNEVDESGDSTDERKHLEKLCMEQAAKIEQLNLLVEQYKHELEQRSTLGSTSTNEIMLLKCKEGENGEQVRSNSTI